MKNSSDEVVRQIFIDYLEQNKRRKTPERFAVLDAAYSFKSYYSIQDLTGRLAERNFPVSRATIYNTLKLLMELRLISCRRLQSGVFYKACYAADICNQICTVCGKVTTVSVPEVKAVLENIHLKRFHKNSYSLYIYGVCSACQAMQTRLKNKENTNNKINISKKNGKRQS